MKKKENGSKPLLSKLKSIATANGYSNQMGDAFKALVIELGLVEDDTPYPKVGELWKYKQIGSASSQGLVFVDRVTPTSVIGKYISNNGKEYSEGTFNKSLFTWEKKEGWVKEAPVPEEELVQKNSEGIIL